MAVGTRSAILMLLVLGALVLPATTLRAEDAKVQRTPEAQALAFLSVEVPRWTTDNKCRSCHNNGDAARALYVARRRGHTLPDKALADTSRWLARPADWDRNGDEAEAQDTGLARLQFASALVEAVAAGQVKEATALKEAAVLVAAGQHKDGSWPVGSVVGNLGAPVTYGTSLATAQARRVLLKADTIKYRDQIGRADQWLRARTVKNVVDAAAVALGLGAATDDEAKKQWRACLALFREGQSKGGGWGPYVTSPPEVFDTAIVVLALAQHQEDAVARGLVKQGRAYLIAAQEKDGSWPETTRPTGGISYAHRLSTSGWATLALLASGKE